MNSRNHSTGYRSEDMAQWQVVPRTRKLRLTRWHPEHFVLRWREAWMSSALRKIWDVFMPVLQYCSIHDFSASFNLSARSYHAHSTRRHASRGTPCAAHRQSTRILRSVIPPQAQYERISVGSAGKWSRLRRQTHLKNPSRHWLPGVCMCMYQPSVYMYCMYMHAFVCICM